MTQITCRLLVNRYSLRNSHSGKPAVLSIDGIAEDYGLCHGPFGTPSEIVVFGKQAYLLRDEIQTAIEATGVEPIQRGEHEDWHAAGIVIEATGTAKEKDGRGITPHVWLHAKTARIVPKPGAEVPDELTQFRTFVIRAIEIGKQLSDGLCKSSDGDLQVGYTWPPVCHEDQRPKAYVSLYAYVFGPHRQYAWYGNSIDEVVRMARSQIIDWLTEDGCTNARAALVDGDHPVLTDPDEEAEVSEAGAAA
ncbi:hypothetical protein CKO28_02980 [Rhodovibrio sodomensis]|uniref:Uncharacterized protein n=1 Tax=Rhodovibrio sodomensis TaxID=1088 RepID=A0ABS1DA59_9PROT|nr:hypothetical protein [Rhodovibrio sodomensis]MBK1667007.1 hypothetical protein [Rhodovibrio sodomensis]